MGLMVGILVGALTLGLGVAAPVQRLRRRRLAARRSRCRRRARWRPRSLIGFAGLGPNRAPAPRFDPACDAAARGATCRCGSPTSATSATCGSSTRCGRGSACSCNASFALTLPPASAPIAAKLAAFATIGAGAIGCVGAGLARRPARPHDADDHRDGGQRQLRGERRTASSAATPVAAGRRLHRLGHQHRRRLGAVLRVDRGAGRSGARRHDADRADRARLHADAGHDPPAAVFRRRAGLALRLRAARDRAGGRRLGDGAAARSIRASVRLAGGRR